MKTTLTWLASTGIICGSCIRKRSGVQHKVCEWCGPIRATDRPTRYWFLEGYLLTTCLTKVDLSGRRDHLYSINMKFLCEGELWAILLLFSTTSLFVSMTI